MNDKIEQSVDATIERTIALTEAVRDFVLREREKPADQDSDPLAHLAAIQQLSRLTNLLANVLSWLMWCKAQAAGEIDRDKLADKARELRDTIQDDAPVPTLPPELADLVGQGHTLYEYALGLAESALK